MLAPLPLALRVLDTYSGATRVLFIVGDPIAQVKSPAGVTQALRARGRDAIVVPAHVAPADLTAWVAAVATMRNVDGIIYTVPHKFAAVDLCHSIAPSARSMGAVNIMRRDASGGWYGDMCDGDGHVDGLRRAGFESRGKRTLVVGAGGAGSAIAHALADAGAVLIAIHDADPIRMHALVEKLARYGRAAATRGSGDPAGYDLVVNATPMGMATHDPLPFDTAALAATTFVSDVVTVPAVPPLIVAARARGCPTMTGSAMFEAVRDRIVAFYSGD